MSLARSIASLLSGGGGVLLPSNNLSDVANAATAVTNLGAVPSSVGQLAGNRNKIINGAMMIDQRNAGASTNNVGSAWWYALDRWSYYGLSANKFSIQQNAGSVTPPVGFSSYLGITVTNAVSPSSTEQYILSQKIEGYNVSDLAFGTASAASVTVSFYVYTSVTGTHSGVLTNSAENRNYPFTFSVSSASTWEKKTVTISGDTTGTWLTNNGIGLWLKINLGTGSSYLGTAGAWTGSSYLSGATGSVQLITNAGATFYITGVQLEKGSVATPFENRIYSDELAMCQRYYQLCNQGVGCWVSSSNVQINLSLYVPMRSAPSVAQTGAMTVTDYVAVDATQSSVGTSIVNSNSFDGSVVYLNNLNSGVVGRVAGIRPYSSNAGRVALSAEL